MRATFLLRITRAVAASSLARGTWRRLWPIAGDSAQGDWQFGADKTWRYRPAGPPPWLVATVVLGVPGFAVFALWMGGTVVGDPQAGGGLALRMWLAGLWSLVAPGLIVVWECRRIGALATIERSPDTDGWAVANLERITPWLDRWVRWPVVLVVTVLMGGGYLATRRGLVDSLGQSGIPLPWTVVGLVCVLWLGLTVGVALWGVLTMLVTTCVALRPGARGPSSRPFDALQVPGLESLSQWAYTTGLAFSVGAMIFLPAILSNLGRVPAAPRAVLLTLSLVVVLGGVACFLVASLWIERLARTQHELALDRLSGPMGNLLDQLAEHQPGQPFPAEAEALVAVHAALDGSGSPPLARPPGLRIATLVVPPVVVVILCSLFGA